MEAGALFETPAPTYDAVKFPPPREFQVKAHEALRQGARAGHRCQLLMSSTGSGKTYLGMRVIHEALRKGKRCIFVCDRRVLINQTSTVADNYGLSGHGIVMADHWRYAPSMPFQIASAQTLAQRQWPENLEVVVIDECFPAGTNISTPYGPKAIESFVGGERIYNCFGETQAASVFTKTAHATLMIGLSNGSTIECTADHPFFTESGWKPASALGIGARLFCHSDVQVLREAVQPEVVQGAQWSDEDRGGMSLQRARMLWEVLREEVEEPDACAGESRKDGDHAAKNRTRAKDAGRKRARADCPATAGAGSARQRVGCGIRGEDKAKGHSGLSASLQDRHRKSEPEGGDRTGRRKSQRHEEAGTRPEKGCAAERPWVESIEVVEHSRGVAVYNLRVDGHPSYFANGILVHNCHVQMRVWVDYLKTFKGHSVLLSATPFSPGLGKIATNLVNAATMHELTEAGVLVPMRVFSCTKVNMKDAATSGGEWTDAAAGERGMEIVGDVVTEWHKFGEGRKTIVFGATIAHCEEMCRQFNQSGVMAAVFCATTTDAEREKLLDEYRKPDSVLRVLLSVAALSRGFDVPDVGCICDVRPLRKSLSEFVQMIGRGARSSPATSKEDFRLLDFSGNIIRFLADFTDFYFNGLATLNDGEKLDKAVRKDEEGAEKKKGCPQCGYKPFSKRCMSCGFEKQSASLVEHEAAGGMVEIRIGKAKAAENAAELWAMCCTYAKSGGNPDKAYGRARHAYKSMMNGQDPPHSFPRFDDAPMVPPSKAVKGKIMSSRIAYLKATGRA